MCIYTVYPEALIHIGTHIYVHTHVLYVYVYVYIYVYVYVYVYTYMYAGVSTRQTIERKEKFCLQAFRRPRDMSGDAWIDACIYMKMCV